MPNLLHWEKGRLKQPLRTWQALTMRRIPRIAIERRAREVGIKIWVSGVWIYFEETNRSAESYFEKRRDNLMRLEKYHGRYIFPEKIRGMDGVSYLKRRVVTFFISKYEGYLLTET